MNNITDGKINNTFLSSASDILADTGKGLSGGQIVKYCNSFALEYNVSIPVSTTDFGKFGSKVPNKRTALLWNLQSFNAEQQFQIIKYLTELDLFKGNEEVVKLHTLLFSRYGHLSKEKISNTELVIKTQHWLGEYPESLKEYNSALKKYESGIFERNTLDDMRLSFEMLIKALLKNNKSLENQMAELGSKLKDADSSEELRNMLPKIIDYYTKFQNNHVKHNDRVNNNEIELIIELTSVFMKYIIKVSGGNING